MCQANCWAMCLDGMWRECQPEVVWRSGGRRTPCLELCWFSPSTECEVGVPRFFCGAVCHCRQSVRKRPAGQHATDPQEALLGPASQAVLVYWTLASPKALAKPFALEPDVAQSWGAVVKLKNSPELRSCLASLGFGTTPPALKVASSLAPSLFAGVRILVTKRSYCTALCVQPPKAVAVASTMTLERVRIGVESPRAEEDDTDGQASGEGSWTSRARRQRAASKALESRSRRVPCSSASIPRPFFEHGACGSVCVRTLSGWLPSSRCRSA